MKVELVSAIFFIYFVLESSGLNSDGVLLMTFKYSVLVDPLSVLQTWNYEHETPCSWRGVSCNNDSRVVSLSLPNSQLLGSIPSGLGFIERLESLDLSNNSVNGSLPVSIFYARELRFLDLSNNMISGEVPATVADAHNLQALNLSDNAMAGKLPANLASLTNLTVVSLKNNYFSGKLPGRWRALEFLDLSSNLINGSLPHDFGGDGIRYLNVSYNQISGEIPPDFGANIPGNATVDLSFNNLTGPIPGSPVFTSQQSNSFSGNPDLCGKPTQNPCPIPSSPFNASAAPTSPPAIAAIPKTIDSNPVTFPNGTAETGSNTRPGLRPGVIIGIIVGDIAGIGILAVVFFYVYRYKKKKSVEKTLRKEANGAKDSATGASLSSSSSLPEESRKFSKWSCLRKEPQTSPSDEEEEDEEEQSGEANQRMGENGEDKKGKLVTVDGETELELETLLKASAYIVGATGSSIMYKAVLEDGTAVAVRRLGENSAVHRRFKDFESHIRAIGKLVHPNLVRLRGFYWATDEKLVIYDFVPNGSLANARYRKGGASPCHIPWETRLKIAKGVARGLAYLHEKKHVHGNLKPSNILLGLDLEPKIGDFGLEWLLTGETSYSRTGGSSRIFGSKRSAASSRDIFHDMASLGPTPSPSPSSVGPISPYSAPESFRNLKPSPKWDVFAFGVILLELLTGKIVAMDEVGHGNGLVVEDGNRALRMADVAIRSELEGKEDFLLGLFKVGYSCASSVPQKRPTMKEVLLVLDKFPTSSAKSSSFHYGH